MSVNSQSQILMDDKNYLKHIKILLSELEAKHLIRAVHRTYQFPDELKRFQYCTILHFSKKYTDGYKMESDGFGTSLTSRYEALFKSVCEAVERHAQRCYKNGMLIKARFVDLKQPALDPSDYSHKVSTRKTTFSWVKAFNVTKNIPCLVPAQLAFLNFIWKSEEIMLTDRNTTGATFGLDPESTLLSGLYEAVERDAFTTMYLTKSAPRRVDLEKIAEKLSPSAQKVIQLALSGTRRYNYELMLFDITHDLGIPTFLAALIDPTGLGKYFNLGLRSSLKTEKAIVGSLLEAISIDSYREQLIKSHGKYPKQNPAKIITLEERGFYWMPQSRIKHLNFIFNQKARNTTVANPIFENPSDELEPVKRLLHKKGMEIFSVNVTPDNFRKLGYLVYKVIVPQLQMLILDERYRFMQKERLAAVATFYGKKKYTINPIPQPFL